jgi:hypothetical protein
MGATVDGTESILVAVSNAIPQGAHITDDDLTRWIVGRYYREGLSVCYVDRLRNSNFHRESTTTGWVSFQDTFYKPSTSELHSSSFIYLYNVD